MKNKSATKLSAIPREDWTGSTPVSPKYTTKYIEDWNEDILCSHALLILTEFKRELAQVSEHQNRIN